MRSRAKQAILCGKPVLSVNLGGVACPTVDILAACGVDLLFIDCERTAISLESVQTLTRFAHAGGIEAIVRSPTREMAYLIRYFDCGIDGLVLPQVESPDECAALRQAAQLATRGRADDLLLIAQVETVGGHAALDALAASPAVDLFLVGPNDLAHSMGLSGDTSRPELKKAVDNITHRLAAAGRPYGLPVTLDDAARWLARGCLFLYTTLESHIRPGVAAMQALMRPPPAPAGHTKETP